MKDKTDKPKGSIDKTPLAYQISKYLVLGSAFVLLVWDIVVTGWVGLGGTISTFVWDLNKAYPILAPAVGFICGHLMSGSARYQGLERKALTPLRWVALTLSAGLVGVEIVAIVLEPGSFTQTLQSTEYAFVRFLIGAAFGRWFWGGPVTGSEK